MISEIEWSKCRPPVFPHPTTDGGKTHWFAETWRRRTDSGWEYRQEPQRYEEPIPPFWEE